MKTTFYDPDPIRPNEGNSSNLGAKDPNEMNLSNMKEIRLARRHLAPRKRTVTVVIPAYNEQEVISEFHRRLTKVLDKLPEHNFEVVYVNDGSRDQTFAQLQHLTADDHRTQILDLSRNFGKEAAMTAGIDHAHGDAIILIDADLQDPPEQIPNMLTAWQQGYDMVCMQRTSRDGESFLKKFTARAFYSLIGRISEVDIPENVGDFRLMSRDASNALKRLPERTRFMKGLFSWVGFKTCILPYRREARFAGTTKWNYWRLWNFALEGLTSFTVAPLKVASYAGILTALSALGYGCFVLFEALIYGNPVPGYPSLMVIILFLGGLQLLALGIIGEYLGRMFVESKQRPLYLLKSHIHSEYDSDLFHHRFKLKSKELSNQ